MAWLLSYKGTCALNPVLCESRGWSGVPSPTWTKPQRGAELALGGLSMTPSVDDDYKHS